MKTFTSAKIPFTFSAIKSLGFLFSTTLKENINLFKDIYDEDDVIKSTKSSSVSPVTRPQEIPATIFLIGTPAAIKDIQEEQVDAIEVEPFDSKVSDTVRIA